MVLRDSISIRLGLRQVKLLRHGLGHALSTEQERVNQRVALELDGALDWLNAADVAELERLLESGVGEEAFAPTSRSERLLNERLRDELGRALRSGDVLAEEPPDNRPPIQREEVPELPRRPPASLRPAPQPAPPEPDLPPEQIDQGLQAETLRAASEQGSPFCEECQKAHAAQGAA